MTNRPKSQHFLAQSYLRGFATGSGRKTILYAYERKKTTPLRQHPSKVARQANYYSVRKPDGSIDDSVEHFLSRVEAEAIPVLRSLASQTMQPGWAERERLAFFIALQELRVPWVRENHQQMYGQMMDWLTKAHARVPGLMERYLKEMEEKGQDLKGVTADSLREFLDRGEYTLTVDPLFSLQIMIKFAPMLYGYYREMKWTVLRAGESHPFVTCDNPVVKIDPTAQGPIAFMNPHLEIRFPLSRTACLLITHDRDREDRWHALMEAGRQSEAKELRETVPITDFFKVGGNVIEAINTVTIRYAARWVYSPAKNPEIAEMLQRECEAPMIQMLGPEKKPVVRSFRGKRQ